MLEVNEAGKQRTLHLRKVKIVQTNGVSVVDVVMSIITLHTHIHFMPTFPKVEIICTWWKGDHWVQTEEPAVHIERSFLLL